MFEIVLKIEGLMCPMCEKHLNETVEGDYTVQSVTSSHSKGETVIISNTEISKDDLDKTVEKAGYKLLDYQLKPYEKKCFLKKLFKK